MSRDQKRMRNRIWGAVLQVLDFILSHFFLQPGLLVAFA